MNKIFFLIQILLKDKGVITLFDQFVCNITGFLASIILGRSLPKEEFGFYALGLTIILSTTNINTSLILSPYTVYSPRYKGIEQARYKGSSLIHQASLSFLFAILILLFGFVLKKSKTQNDLGSVLWILGFVITFILLREYSRRLFFAHMQMVLAFWLDLLVAIFYIGGLVLLLKFNALSVTKAFLAMGTACGLSAILLNVFSRNEFKIYFPRIIADFRKNFQFGKWLLLSGIAYIAITQSYPWLLKIFRDAASVGILAACIGTISIIKPFLAGIENFLGPITAHSIVKGGVDELRKVVFKYTIYLMIIMIAFCLIMIVFGGFIVKLMYGCKYSGNGNIVALLAISQLVSAITFPLNHGLLALQKPIIHFRSSFFALILTLPVGIILVNSYGALGVAYGLMLGNIIGSAYRIISYKKQIMKSDAEKITYESI